jgi:hypothetical protein
MGGRRDGKDQFLTHEIVSSNIVRHMLEEEPAKGLIVEPSAGWGSFVKALRARLSDRKIIAVELDEDFIPKLKDESGASKVLKKDFLEWTPEGKKGPISPSLIIGNPPFSRMKEFIEHSLELTKARKGRVIYLLRGAALESKGRVDLMAGGPLKRVVVLVNRPSFIRFTNEEKTEYDDKGSDMAMYAVLEWDWTWEYAPYIEFMQQDWRKLIRESNEPSAKKKKAPKVKKGKR